MAFLGLTVPAPTARLLSEIDISQWGDPEPPGKFHITMLYIGKDIDIARIGSMIEPIFSVTSQTRPFTVATSHATTFPPNPDDGTPIIARVQSNELHTLRAAIVGAFTSAGIEFSNKYPDYTPHVTLGYSKDPEVSGLIDIDFPTLEWGAAELTLWGGDSGDNRIIITFPFSLAMTKQAVHRAFVQLSARWRGDQGPSSC